MRLFVSNKRYRQILIENEALAREATLLKIKLDKCEDAYLKLSTKKGTKAWKGVDPSEFVAEQRGRTTGFNEPVKERLVNATRQCPKCGGEFAPYELYCGLCGWEREVEG